MVSTTGVDIQGMFELLALPFFQRALLVGIILGMLMAIMGVMVVLRRLSFFSDAIGHSALTGIAIGVLLNVNPFITGLIFSCCIALGITWARRYSKLPIDTILGVSFPAAVALGIILVQLTPGYQTDLLAFLFGDILTVSTLDISISLGLSLAVGILMLAAGKALITIALDESLAHAEGIAVFWYEVLLLVLLAAVIAMAIKLVGIVLVTAMLVIPAATAQNLAWSLSSMFAFSVAVSIIATFAGMLVSAAITVPSGPTIVLVAGTLFVSSLFLSRPRGT